MTPFGPLQPHEWLAILATALDLALTVYGVWSGRAREAGAVSLLFKGKRAAIAVIVVSVLLHLLIRYRLSDADSWGPRMQAGAWNAVACVRGAIVAWNIIALSKGRH